MIDTGSCADQCMFMTYKCILKLEVCNEHDYKKKKNPAHGRPRNLLRCADSVKICKSALMEVSPSSGREIEVQNVTDTAGMSG